LTGSESRSRHIARVLLAAIYLAAGTLHLAIPRPFMSVMPPWVPQPATIVGLTGACEIAGAIGLLWPPTRRWAGIMLAIYALCVYPANIMHAVRDLSTGTGLGWGYHYPRLFAQPLICWWALWAGGATSRR
jgi:uncharacterized membrane protein